MREYPSYRSSRHLPAFIASQGVTESMAEHPHSVRDGDGMSAIGALENVISRLAGTRHKQAERITFDPASGAAIIPASLDRKIENAIRRSARQIAFRLYFGRLGLEVRIFSFEARRASLKLRRDLSRFLANNAFSRHW